MVEDPIVSAYFSLPEFDGYPYLVTRITAAVHHLILMPRYLTTDDELERIARRQFAANRLETSLVLWADRVLYLGEDGASWSGVPPRCSLPVCDKLPPPADTPLTSDMLKREQRLRSFVAANTPRPTGHGSDGRGPYVVDRAHGRPATAEDRAWLSRRRPNGAPAGLQRCDSCGAYRGMGLLEQAGLVVEVFCRCQNHNRCARCFERFSERRLNGCGFFEESGEILHVPAFAALDHICPARPSRRGRLRHQADGIDV